MPPLPPIVSPYYLGHVCVYSRWHQIVTARPYQQQSDQKRFFWSTFSFACYFWNWRFLRRIYWQAWWVEQTNLLQTLSARDFSEVVVSALVSCYLLYCTSAPARETLSDASVLHNWLVEGSICLEVDRSWKVVAVSHEFMGEIDCTPNSAQQER